MRKCTNQLIVYSNYNWRRKSQYSCLENPVDRGAWWAAVHEVAQNRTRLKRLSMHAWIGEGHGNSLQYPCLENPRDRGAWWAAVYGVTQSWTRLKLLSSSSVGRRKTHQTRNFNRVLQLFCRSPRVSERSINFGSECFPSRTSIASLTQLGSK